MQAPSPFGSMDVNAPLSSTADTHTLSAEALDQMAEPLDQTAEPHSQSVQWPLTHNTQRDRSDRASSPGGLGLPRPYPYKPPPSSKDLKSAGSLPILQSALHRRFAFAQGMGILPPSLGVTPTHEGPFPPQALILKDNSHRREAYAKGQGALPPPSSSRQMQPSLPRVNSSDSDSLHESESSTFVTMPEAPDLMTGLNDALGGTKGVQGRLAPSGRAMKQVESFNTDVVRQCIDKAQKAEASDKHISSAGELTILLPFCAQIIVVTVVSEHKHVCAQNCATSCVGVPLMQWQCGCRRCSSSSSRGDTLPLLLVLAACIFLVYGQAASSSCVVHLLLLRGPTASSSGCSSLHLRVWTCCILFLCRASSSSVCTNCPFFL